MSNKLNTTIDSLNEFRENVSRSKIHEAHSELINKETSQVDKAHLSQSITEKKEAIVKNQIVKK